MSVGVPVNQMFLGPPAGPSPDIGAPNIAVNAYRQSSIIQLTAPQACQSNYNVHPGSRYMNPPAPIQYTQTHPQHGIKRSAPDDEFESTANISGELKKLRLNNVRPSVDRPLHTGLVNTNNHVDGQTRIGQSNSATNTTPISTSLLGRRHDTPHLGSSREQLTGHNTDNANGHEEDSMRIDETPHRVYISDLAREIAEIEASEKQQHHHHITYDDDDDDNNNDEEPTTTIFLPDVDKNISKIPLNVLRQQFDSAAAAAAVSRATAAAAEATRSANAQALILYRDPSSISVPEEEDAVRKAIIAARRDAREKMKLEHQSRLQLHSHGQGQQQQQQQQGAITGASPVQIQALRSDHINDDGNGGGGGGGGNDEDAMDLG